MTIENLGVKLYSGLKSDRVSDSLGSSADGTNTNVTLDTTNENLGTGCYDFNGSTSKVECGDWGTQPTQWTMAFWFKSDSVTNYKGFINSGGAGGSYGFRIEQYTGGKMKFDWERSGGSDGMDLAGGSNTNIDAIVADQWYHVTIQGNQTTDKVTAYVNGVFSADMDFDEWSKTDSSNDSNFNNFEFGLGSSWYYDGLIDDFGFWDKVLPLGTDEDTEGSIKWLYNTGTGRLANTITGGLKAYYSFDKLYDEAYKSTYGQSTEDIICTNTITNGTKACGVKIINTDHNGKKIINGKWKLKREGTLTGNCYMRVWNSTASSDVDTNVEATSQAVDMSTLPTSHGYVTFNFDSEVTLSNGYVIGIFTKDITDGSGSKCIKLGEFHNGSSTIPSGYNLQALDKDTTGWTDTGYPTLITPDAIFTSQGCVNNYSSTPPLDDLTGVRDNSIFTQTDDVPAYYWYQTLDGTTAWFPTFQDSMTDSSVWTPVGSGLSITGGQVSASSVALNGNNRIYRSFGMTLSDKWVAEFDFNVTSIANNAFALIFVVTAGSSDLDNGTSQDNIKFFLDDDALNAYMRSQLGTTQGTNTSGLGSLTANTTYYARITKDGTSGTIKLYSDSDRTTETNSATTTFQAVSGLTYFQSGAMSSGNSGNGTWVVGNLKIYDGVSSV